MSPQQNYSVTTYHLWCMSKMNEKKLIVQLHNQLNQLICNLLFVLNITTNSHYTPILLVI